MNIFNDLRKYRYLYQSFISYLLLGLMDIVHHLHAALALKQDNAIHAVVTGAVLLPLAIILIVMYLQLQNKYFIGGFIAISGLAVTFPGLYHGGWDHLIKIISYLRLDGPTTNISSLFPADDFHYWFYEISGTLELVISIVSAYYLFKLVSHLRRHANRKPVVQL